MNRPGQAEKQKYESCGCDTLHDGRISVDSPGSYLEIRRFTIPWEI
jgi:hypothetical protein